jgi:hypothetical protein
VAAAGMMATMTSKLYDHNDKNRFLLDRPLQLTCPVQQSIGCATLSHLEPKARALQGTSGTEAPPIAIWNRKR